MKRALRSTPRRWPLVAVALALWPAGAADAQNQQGQFSSPPPRRIVVGRPPLTLGATTVGNTTAKNYTVRVFAVFVRQRIDGSFVFINTPAEQRAANNILS